MNCAIRTNVQARNVKPGFCCFSEEDSGVAETSTVGREIALLLGLLEHGLTPGGSGRHSWINTGVAAHSRLTVRVRRHPWAAIEWAIPRLSMFGSVIFSLRNLDTHHYLVATLRHEETRREMPVTRGCVLRIGPAQTGSSDISISASRPICVTCTLRGKTKFSFAVC